MGGDFIELGTGVCPSSSMVFVARFVGPTRLPEDPDCLVEGCVVSFLAAIDRGSRSISLEDATSERHGRWFPV